MSAITAVMILTTVAFSPQTGFAQTTEQSATYVSQLDQDLTIRKIALLPVIDNVDGIYARPIEAELKTLFQGSHRWDFTDSNIAGATPTLIELEESPTEVQRVARNIDTDALIGATASKGPNGLSIRLNLFLKKDGKLLAQELIKDHPRFDLAEVRARVRELQRRLVAKLPYDGLILSRDQNRVTINLGRVDGIAKDHMLTAVQIISVNRHPKFNFAISTEKEILGRIKILKVDETLSFGAIVSEKERGAVQRFGKIAGLQPVTYPEPTSLGEGGAGPDLKSRSDASITFGKDPREWLPVRPPSFGQVGVKLGFGSHNSSVNLDSVGAFETHTPLYPSIAIHGELWLSPEWIVRADMLQGMLTSANPRSGSSPDNLNHTLSRYSLEVGYNLLLREDFFGPKLQLNGGFSKFSLLVADSSPRSVTSAAYSGFYLGLSGSFPITDEKLWYLGGRLNLHLIPTLQEDRFKSGGSPKNTVNEFSFYGERKIAENLRATASIDFSAYGTVFSGRGTRVDSSGNPETATTFTQRDTTVTAGINYMF